MLRFFGSGLRAPRHWNLGAGDAQLPACGKRGGHLTAVEGLRMGELENFTGEPPNCANADAGNGDGILRAGLADEDGEMG